MTIGKFIRFLILLCLINFLFFSPGIGAGDGDGRAIIKNLSHQKVFCSCELLDANGQHIAVKNFTMEVQEEESLLVKEGIFSCCHAFNESPRETNCWTIGSGSTKEITP